MSNGAPDFEKLAPWDAMGYFQAPQVSTFTTAGGGSLGVVAPGNPNRVGLLFSSFGGNVTVCCGIPALSTVGLLINTQTPVLSLENAIHGPLTQFEWTGFGGAGITLTVIELILLKLPSA